MNRDALIIGWAVARDVLLGITVAIVWLGILWLVLAAW